VQSKIDKASGWELEVVAATLKDQLDPLVKMTEMNRRIESLVDDEASTVKSLFRKMLLNRMGFSLNDGVYMDGRAEAILDVVRDRAQASADDVGLVEEELVVDSLPDTDWHRFWPWLRERSGLFQIYGMLGIRNTEKARTKAALILIGRPATREEVASVLGCSPLRLGSVFSNIPGVVRADKNRWGLREWVEEEYEGLPAMIASRIEESGGSAEIESLLEELPEKFSVSQASVITYIHLDRFRIDKGRVYLASKSSIRLRNLDDVINGRNADGAPYWTFEVADRYFEGYSLTGFPRELAKLLGCQPDSNLNVRIENFPDCRGLSLIWNLSSTTGVSLGYLKEPLRLLSLQPGDRARITVKGESLVELLVEERQGEPGQGQPFETPSDEQI